MLFVPFADRGLVPRDLWRLAEVINAEASQWPTDTVSHHMVRILAAAIINTLGWTVAWARIVGYPPVPCTQAYESQVRGALFHAWRNGAVITNPKIVSTNARSFRGYSSACKTTTKIEEIMQDIRGILCRLDAAGPDLLEQPVDEVLRVAGGRGFPGDGYMAKLARDLLWHLGLRLRLGPSVILGSGSRAGLAALTKEDPKCYLVQAVARDRMDLLLRSLEAQWEGTGSAVSKPSISSDDIATMLCVWSSSGFSVRATSHSQVMAHVD